MFACKVIQHNPSKSVPFKYVHPLKQQNRLVHIFFFNTLPKCINRYPAFRISDDFAQKVNFTLILHRTETLL